MTHSSWRYLVIGLATAIGTGCVALPSLLVGPEAGIGPKDRRLPPIQTLDDAAGMRLSLPDVAVPKPFTQIEVPGYVPAPSVPTHWEIRSIYTEAVVRSAAERRDYHLGLIKHSGSDIGYEFTATRAERPGITRVHYLNHTLLDDPHFPKLDQPDRTLNPASDPGAYFLGPGVAWTSPATGDPAAVADGLEPGNAIGAALGLDEVWASSNAFPATETRFKALWSGGIAVREASASWMAIAGTTFERPLTSGATTRIYKWRFPFAAKEVNLGSNLPVGRLVVDIRALDQRGNPFAFSAMTHLLQPGDQSFRLTGEPSFLKWERL